MFDSLDAITKVGATGDTSGAIAKLSDDDKKAFVVQMQAGVLTGMSAGLLGGYYTRDRVPLTPTRLALAGAGIWLGSRFVLGSSLDAKLSLGTPDALKSVTMGDWAAPTLGGTFGLTWLGIGVLRLIRS